MAKSSPAPTPSKKAAVSVKAKTEATSAVSANPRLVAAIRGFDEAKATAQTLLVEIGTIAQQESLTKNEVVASLMAARGVEKNTAESQYSRMKKIFSDPEVLEKLKNGEMDLKEAREKTTKKQENPSESKKQENANKRLAKGIAMVLGAAKELGTDIASIINTFKAAGKKAGLK